MLEPIMRASPLPATPATLNGVTLSPAAPMRRYSLRGRDPARLAAIVGRDLPDAIGAVAGGILQLGPDEYYALLPAGEDLPSGAGEAVSIVDISSRAVGIIVEGPRAAEAIMAGCPLDLERMAPGRATRTIFESVEMVVLRQSEARFHIEVWRSFAPWLWQSLADAAY